MSFGGLARLLGITLRRNILFNPSVVCPGVDYCGQQMASNEEAVKAMDMAEIW